VLTNWRNFGGAGTTYKADEQATGAPQFTEEGFRLLYDETFDETLRVARGICGSDEDAKEACQDAYVALARYWSSGRLREPPRRLLFRALQRSAIDALRARLRRERRVGLSGPAATLSVRGPLERALRRLRDEDAALLVTQSVIGMTYEELADVQGMSVSAIRARLFRIRQKLARAYEQEGGEW
jgi:DNA-directed RNA polymerase specialized sigma24 family protein